MATNVVDVIIANVRRADAQIYIIEQ